MADTQNIIYAKVFSKNIMPTVQQSSSLLYPVVYKKSGVNGEVFFQDQIGEWAMTDVNGRAPATPRNDPLFGRRMGAMVDKHDNRILAKEDDLKIISDPKSMMTLAARSAIGRTYDDVMIAAALGTSYYGVAGGSSQVLPSAQKIANGSAGLTVAKVRQAKYILDEDCVPMEGRYLVVSPQGHDDLLADTTATSSDYVGKPVMTEGNITRFLGFNIIMSTRLGLAATIRSCFAFQREGLCFAEATGPFVKTGENMNYSYAWEVYYSVHIGSTRLEEKRVVQVDIVEA